MFTVMSNGNLDSIKNKIYGSNNHEEIRDNSRGDNYNEGDEYAQKFRQSNLESQNKDPYENHSDQPISNLDDLENPEFQKREPFQDPTPALEDQNFQNEQNFQTPQNNQRNYLTTDENKRYDIEDRLNIIEAQLQAIRSQTETINERLKNIDSKLGRRF